MSELLGWKSLIQDAIEKCNTVLERMNKSPMNTNDIVYTRHVVGHIKTRLSLLGKLGDHPQESQGDRVQIWVLSELERLNALRKDHEFSSDTLRLATCEGRILQLMELQKLLNEEGVL